VVGFVGEEKYGKGAAAFREKPPEDIDYIISAEASGIDAITTGYKGLLDLRFTIYTRAGHSSAPEGRFINAIEVAFQLWEKIKKYTNSKTESYPFFDSMTSKLIRIRGGTGFNIVPDRCRFEINVRIPPKFDPEKVHQDIENLVEKFKLTKPKVRIKMKLLDKEEPFVIEEDTLFVEVISDAVGEIIGQSPRLLKKAGTGDINVITESLDIPAVAYGPGNAHVSHGPIENLKIRDYTKSIGVYENILEKLVILYFALDKMPRETEISISPSKFEQILQGTSEEMLEIPTEKRVAITNLLLELIDKKAKNKGLEITPTTKEKITNLLLLMAKGVGESL